MRDDDYEVDDESSYMEKKIEKTKEKILDETFKKAEILKVKNLDKGQEKIFRKVERTFLKSGILLIIIAIIAIAFIVYSPLMYINHQTNEGVVEQFIYIDFDKEAEINQTILDLFDSPCTNCSNNSQNYIGLTFDDLIDSPQKITNGVFLLIIVGIIFTVFVIIDKFLKFSDEIFYAIHSLFFISVIFISIVILISTIKFIGTYFLLFHNRFFIEMSGIKNVNIIFLTPIVIAIITLIIIRGSIMILKINYHEIEKKFSIDEPEKLYPTLIYGSKFE